MSVFHRLNLELGSCLRCKCALFASGHIYRRFSSFITEFLPQFLPFTMNNNIFPRAARDKFSRYISRRTKSRPGGSEHIGKCLIEIYAKSPEAIHDDLFIYIDIFNLCGGVRARMYLEDVQRDTRLVLMRWDMHATCTHTLRDAWTFRFDFEGDSRSVRRENSLASRVKTESRGD